MANRRAGPICSFQLGSCRAEDGRPYPPRACRPGPEGLDLPHSYHSEIDPYDVAPVPVVKKPKAAVKSATPKMPERLPGEKAMLWDYIDRISKSPFGHSPNGRTIVHLLRRLDAQDGIAYGETGDDRGWFYGTGITVNKDYYANVCKTILELVHE